MSCAQIWEPRKLGDKRKNARCFGRLHCCSFVVSPRQRGQTCSPTSLPLAEKLVLSCLLNVCARPSPLGGPSLTFAATSHSLPAATRFSASRQPGRFRCLAAAMMIILTLGEREDLFLLIDEGNGFAFIYLSHKYFILSFIYCVCVGGVSSLFLHLVLMFTQVYVLVPGDTSMFVSLYKCPRYHFSSLMFYCLVCQF